MARGRIWTKEDDEYLMEKWGNTSVKSIAKKLKRSISAIKLRTYRLGLDEFYAAGDLLLVRDLIEALGYSYTEYVINKFKEYGLPIRYVGYNKRRYRKISIDDFWKWSEFNKDVVNFAFFEENNLGKEPKWVKEKRRIDKTNYANKRVFWTREQEFLLISKARTGRYTYADLASDFNRSEQAVRRKLFDLGEPPIAKKRKRERYSKEEEQKILEMREQGFDFSIIARQLKRSESGIKDKYNRLIS